jgi:tetratricopeptide (TPR) repeat protein
MSSLVWRWSIVASSSLVIFGGLSAGLISAGLNSGLAVGLAAVPFTVALTLGGAWAGHKQPSPRGQKPDDDGSEATKATVVIGEIPRKPVVFVDRAEQLEALLSRSDRHSADVFVVTGLRGVGKSQLAATIARQRINEGWRVVAWINADSRDDLLSGFEQLAAALGLADVRQDSQKAADFVRHRLEADGEQSLLVLDNAADADIVQHFLPATGKAQMIITSSRQALASLGTPIPLDVLTPAQAVAYLDQRTGLRDEVGAAQVAHELGYLPLALAQASAVIAGQHLSYSMYLTRLAAVPTASYLGRTEGDPYPSGTAEAIRLSLDSLNNQDPSGLSRQLLDIISLLSPQGTARGLLVRSVEATEGAVDRSMQMLADSSLVAWSMDGSTLTAHRLVMRVVREYDSSYGTMRIAARRAINGLMKSWPPVEQAWMNAAVARDLLQHTIALEAQLRPYSDVLDNEAVADLLKLRMWAGFYLNQMKDSSRAIPIWLGVVSDYELLFGPESPETMMSRRELAAAYRNAGRIDKSTEIDAQNLIDRTRILGVAHPETLASSGDLADDYQESGRLDLAIPLLERTLSDRIRVLGRDHQDTLRSRNNLARAYRHLGRFSDAIPLDEQNLADRLRILGPDHPDTLESRGSLARAYQAAGRLNEAIPLLEQNLADRIRILGPEHPDTFSSRGNLALAYQAAGRLNEAIALNEDNLAARIHTLGTDHPDTLTSQGNLASTYYAAGRLDEAIPALEQNVADRQRILGPDHPDTLTAKGNLALAYQAAGRLDEAIPALEQNVADRQRILGPDHPDTLTAKGNLALAYQAAGRLDEAIPALEQALAGSERVLGSSHPVTRTIRDYLRYAHRLADS